MRTRRLMTACLLLLCMAAGALPALALASGSSAGDSQYTDPLATNTTTTPSTTPTPSTATTPSPSTASGSATATPSTTTTPSTPTAPDAGSATTTATSSHTLPYTGFSAWLGAGIGAAMLALGLGLKRRLVS